MANRRKFKKRRRLFGALQKSKPLYSKYESAYKFFAVTAVCTLISSAVYALICRSAPGVLGVLLAILTGTGGIWLGYVIAAVWGKLTSCQRVRYDHSYERSESYFTLGTLVPSMITAAVPSVIALTAARKLTATVTSSGTVIYDNASVIPVLVAGTLFGCLTVGILLWFIPYNKVISLGNVLPIGIGFIIVALAGALFLGASTAFLTVAFIFYIFSSMAVINQGYIIKIINDSGTGTATSEVRKYNLAAVGLVFLAIAVAGFFSTAVIVGIVVSARIVFYSLFRPTQNNGEGGSVGSSPSFNASKKLFGGITKADGEGEKEAMVYYVVFLIMILAFFVALIVYRKRHGKRLPRVSELINRLYGLLLAIFSWFGIFFSPKRQQEADIPLDDYTDEEAVMDKNALKGIPELSGKRGAKRFAKMLNECSSDSERLSLCYRVSRAEYIKSYNILKSGDTPHVILKKLNGLTAEQDYLRFVRLTEAFVKKAYAETDPDQYLSDDITAEAERLISQLSST